MVKLEAKKDIPKMSREERRQRQQQREQELNALLAMKQTQNVDADTIMQVAQEGGEIQASEVTNQDERRLNRLKKS